MLQYQLPSLSGLEKKMFISSATACQPHVSSVALLPGIFTPGSRLAAVHVSGMLLVIVEGTGIVNIVNALAQK